MRRMRGTTTSLCTRLTSSICVAARFLCWRSERAFVRACERACVRACCHNTSQELDLHAAYMDKCAACVHACTHACTHMCTHARTRRDTTRSDMMRHDAGKQARTHAHMHVRLQVSGQIDLLLQGIHAARAVCSCRSAPSAVVPGDDCELS